MSHDNLTWTARATLEHVRDTGFGQGPREELVSYLPLSHIAAQLLDIYLPMAITAQDGVSCRVTFARPDALRGTLGTTLKQVSCRTSFFLSALSWDLALFPFPRQTPLHILLPGASHRLSWRAPGVGEDPREAEGRGCSHEGDCYGVHLHLVEEAGHCPDSMGAGAGRHRGAGAARLFPAPQVLPGEDHSEQDPCEARAGSLQTLWNRSRPHGPDHLEVFWEFICPDHGPLRNVR